MKISLITPAKKQPRAGNPRSPSRHYFDICVIDHLRDEKDSLRTALAVGDLPASSRIRVIHLGKAHDGNGPSGPMRR